MTPAHPPHQRPQASLNSRLFTPLPLQSIFRVPMTSVTLSASKPFAHGLSQPAFPSAWLHPREASSSPARISVLDASGAQGWAQTEGPCPSAPGLRHSPWITTYIVSPSSPGPSSRHCPQSFLLCSLEFAHGKEITYIFRPWPLG